MSTSNSPTQSATLLIEVFTEELPPKSLHRLGDAFKGFKEFQLRWNDANLRFALKAKSDMEKAQAVKEIIKQIVSNDVLLIN